MGSSPLMQKDALANSME